MATRRRLTAENWIIEALSDGDKGGPCTTLSLVYIKGDGHSTEEIHSKNLKGATHNAKQLADFFTAKATGFAQDLPGNQNFKLLAYYNGAEQHQASFPLIVSNGDVVSLSESNFAQNSPTEKGFLAQMMRHNEVMTGMMADVFKTVLVQSIQREEKMRGEVNEAQLIVRDVMLNMTKEQHANALAQLAYTRETAERQLIAKAIPALVNNLTGREIVPQSYADSEIIDSLATRVKPEHLKLLEGMGMLTPEMSTILAARFTRTLEANEKERQALRVMPPEETPEKAAE